MVYPWSHEEREVVVIGAEALEGLKVVLVDDEPGVLRALSLILRAARCDVTAFTSPEEVLNHLHTAPLPDVILSDLRMPALSGVDLLRSLRSSGFTTPFILMSGHAGPLEIAEARAERLTAFLSKPFNPQQLLAALSGISPTHPRRNHGG